MTKKDLVLRIAKATKVPQYEVAKIVQMFLDGVSEELIMGGNLEFRNFGIFELVKRKSRIGRNPRKADIAIEIPERVVVKFRPGKTLKAKVAKISPQDISK
jgi:nucleoid DNA-binding protein